MEMSNKIGKYEKLRLLGSGSYGNVYEATLDGRSYAIKSIPGEDFISYVSEGTFLNLLSHPNIIKSYEIFYDEVNKTVNLVMPKMADEISHIASKPLEI